MDQPPPVQGDSQEEDSIPAARPTSESAPALDTIPRKPKPSSEHPNPSSVMADTASASASILDRPIPRKKRAAPSATTSSSQEERSTPRIPRKPRAKPKPLPLSNKKPRLRLPMRRTPKVVVQSEHPFVIVIKNFAQIPLNNGGIPMARASARMPKRKRPSYEELRDSDSEDDDDLLTDSDEDDDSFTKKRPAKSRRRSPTDSMVSSGMEGHEMMLTDEVIAEAGIDSPPPGTLSTLWYSREVYLNVFVIEKIIGWRARPIVSLDWADNTDMKELDSTESAIVRGKLLTREEVWTNQLKRMEISRINAAQCPIVMAVMAAKEEQAAQGRGGEPHYRLTSRKEDEREEVLLVKWRGRSHLHCSWERRKDLEKFDPSNTARSKIRRYIQNQEFLLGPNWKHVIEEERSGGGEDDDGQANAEEAEQHAMEEEEFFPSQYLEVERILACDENEMNMQVLAKQRALNLRSEQDQERKREEAQALAESSELGTDAAHVHLKPPGLLENLPRITDADEPWDPEDNVRYVVKWKGLQFQEITWEYWRDIKRDAVDEAEDFWYRQRAPTLAEVNQITSRPHPRVRDFKKLTKSPEFAVSHQPRPIADLGDGFVDDSGEDDENGKAFKLRGYQLEGVNWLLFNWVNRRSCILADEMGLGKTIQTVCFLHQLHEMPSTQVRGPFLVVAPLTLIGQWQSESHTWTPDFNVVFYHGKADARDFLVQQEFYYTDQFTPKSHALRLKKQHITKFHILITTYEIVLKDIDVLSKIKWKALIVDEAHRLKNQKARLFEELAKVPREFCLLLTGTPLQNSTEELWALLHFAEPKVFASKDSFVGRFGQLKDAKQVSDLHAMLKPYLLRRVKEDVEKSLPPKEETILEVSLTPIQKKYYKAIYERNTAFLFKGAKPSNAPSLMNVMMELRKCCNHPFLIRGAEERILNEAAAALKDQKNDSGTAEPVDYLKLYSEELVKSSGKMVLLEKLLPKLYDGGHKVLIFSQMVRSLDLIEELLKIMKYRYERLDGSTTASARSAAVHRFHRKACQRFVMLLSTRAGGLGLNLTAADVVIIFDSDWNPQNDLQAMARAHRIGQTRAVSVYRLLTAKTYEAHMLHSASMKLGLDRAVLAHQRLQEGESSEESKKKSKSERAEQAKEIDQLLKKGAYDIFRDEDDAEAKKFMETDIDQLLERSAKKVTYGTTNTSSISSGLGSFSKASFVADTGDGGKDVDLDDPDFWEKAVGLEAPPEETPEDVAQMIDDGIKRSRKQVQQYNPYAAFEEAEQKKQEKIEKKAMEEKEEKKRLRLLKKQQRLKEKERKKKEKEEARGRLLASKREAAKYKTGKDAKPKSRDVKLSKKLKKSERQRALKRVENEDPVLERLKQAWEVSQRNRATSAALRFGFGRFCKVRTESRLHSLPIQDVEVFVRQYVYQLSLQVAVTLLAMLRSQVSAEDGQASSNGMRCLLQKWLGPTSAVEVEWICSSISSGIQMQIEVEQNRRLLRMPIILAEPEYTNELRQGAALRALRRIGVLNRLNRLVEDALEKISTGLGYEELGKRGCPVKDLSALDADLKARHITTEELVLTLSSHLHDDVSSHRKPAAWWDRSCDIALLLGTFVYGFGNYEKMRNDKELPFARKIGELAEADISSSGAYLAFHAATRMARKTCDAALESAKAKQTEEAHMMVAAVVKARKEAEKEGLSGKTVVPSEISLDDIMETDDSHLVTLPRLSQNMIAAIRGGPEEAGGLPLAGEREERKSTSKKDTIVNDDDDGDESDTKEEEVSLSSQQRLPMPDARILNHHLVHILNIMEKNAYNETAPGDTGEVSFDRDWEATESVRAHEAARKDALTRVMGLSEQNLQAARFEFAGIGFSGSQCATTHRTLNDASDFSVGAASRQLSFVATGTDAPRYLRGMGVPMNFTRFAIVGLIYADASTLNKLIEDEQLRCTAEQDQKAEDDAKREDLTHEAKKEEVAKDNAKSVERTMEEKKLADDALKKGTSPPAEKDFNEQATSPDAKPPPPQDPLELPGIMLNIRNSHSLRAGICAAALQFGFPSLPTSDGSVVHPSVLSALQCSAPSSMFDNRAFVSEAGKFVNGIVDVGVEDVIHYVESALLPHCLRLCINGNGPRTRMARASRGRFETALGFSLYPEYTKSRQTPLPDPCTPLSEHSIEALTCALAILRRVRLLRAAQYLVGIEATPLLEFLRTSSALLVDPENIVGSDDMPLWWCPWIHDLGLLVNVACSGLSGIWNPHQGVLTAQSIQQFIDKSFIDNKSREELPFPDQTEVKEWIQEQSHQLPSPNTLERRLGYVCSLLTQHLDTSPDARYDHLPMFDHGGWPRN